MRKKIHLLLAALTLTLIGTSAANAAYTAGYIGYFISGSWGFTDWCSNVSGWSTRVTGLTGARSSESPYDLRYFQAECAGGLGTPFRGTNHSWSSNVHLSCPGGHYIDGIDGYFKNGRTVTLSGACYDPSSGSQYIFPNWIGEPPSSGGTYYAVWCGGTDVGVGVTGQQATSSSESTLRRVGLLCDFS